MITAEQRGVCRRALGEDVLREARQLAAIEFETENDPISLHPDLVANDFRIGWLTPTFEAHERVLRYFRESDLTDPRWVGRNLRHQAAQLLREAFQLTELTYFLAEFDEESPSAVLWGWGMTLVRQSALVILQCAEADADELLAIRDEIRGLDEALAVLHQAVTSIASRPQIPDLAVEDIVEVALGEQPTQPLHSHAVGRSFPGPPSRYVELGMRQLRLIAETIFVLDAFATNYLGLALKLCTSMFPLMAHRSATLTGELVFRAALVDTSRTARLLMEFNNQQAGRIVTAGREYEALVADLFANHDTPDLPEAYRTIAEGILRPYGSLLVCLEQLALGERVEYRASPTLGDLETSLAGVSPRLAALADHGMSRELRNFDAHEDIVRSETGALAAVDRGGTMHMIDIDGLFERMLLLRSFLDGVDVAINVGVVGLSAPTQNLPDDYVRTEALLESIARLAAAELTDGMVKSLTIRGGVTTVVYSGRSTPAQLRLLAHAIRRQSSEITRIEIHDTLGSVLLEDA